MLIQPHRSSFMQFSLIDALRSGLFTALWQQVLFPVKGYPHYPAGGRGSQGGGPVRRVKVLFRMFFSVAKQITVQVATQRNVNAPLPIGVQR